MILTITPSETWGHTKFFTHGHHLNHSMGVIGKT
jgi:hypothetical protein